MSSQTSSEPPQDIKNFKFIIIGDAGVGKTSILHHLVFGKCI